MRLRRLLTHLRDERGASLAVATVMLVGVLSVLALAIDLGMLYTARGEAQRAADAAALGGASALLAEEITTVEIDLAKQRAKEIAAVNTIRNELIDTTFVEGTALVETTEEAVIEVMPADDRVRVTISRQGLPLWFARLFGRSFSGVSAAATAWASPADAMGSGCLLPLAAPDIWHTVEGDIYPNGIWDFEVGLGCPGNCPERELWTFSPEEGDWYERAAHGYGTNVRDGVEDYYSRSYNGDHGRRLPMKINFPGDGPEASFWFPWVFPGSGWGVAHLLENIKSCAPGDYQIGDTLSPDDESEEEVVNQPGMYNLPVFNAITDFIDGNTGNPVIDERADPDAYWDESTGTVVNSRYGDNWRESSRIVTIALFHPEDMTQGRTSMRIVDFIDMFLEDPRVNHTHINPSHHRPITGRLLKFGRGGPGEHDRSRTMKYLRLVE